MIGMVVRRLLQLPLILLAVYTITFVLAWLLPGEAVLNDEGRQPPAEVLAAMKDSSPDTRVLIISSMDAEPVVQQAMTAGAVGFVGKPFHPLEIALAVRQALAH